jgi:chromosome segregation ATPase
MARAGISRNDVEQARDAVIARGARPSIDAVRIELGNTGSKSTIHRYLQAIVRNEGTRLDDEQLLSDTLKTSVASLAAQLRSEAQAIIEAAQEKHDQAMEKARTQLSEMERALTEASKANERLNEELAAERNDHKATHETLHQEQVRIGELTTENQALTVRLNEHEQHIESLEEKHRHVRDSLEHYRQSVKDQRDQDQRRHEAQLQQLQAELRQQGQSLSVKQNEVTQVSRDNARLAAELADLHSQEHQAQQELKAAGQSLDSLKTKTTRLETVHELQTEAALARTEAHENLQAEYSALREQNDREKDAVRRLESRLEAQANVHTELMERLDRLQQMFQTNLSKRNECSEH